MKDYEYSSWGEYTGQVEPTFQICDTLTVLKRIPFNDLNEWVNEPLPDNACYLDGDEELPLNRYSDEEAWKVIKELTRTANASEFQKLKRTERPWCFSQATSATDWFRARPNSAYLGYMNQVT